MYKVFENIYNFFSKVFELMSLKIKSKKIEDPQDEENDWTNLIIKLENLEK
jgi:hypothetical protein